jgi:hypothetical protein
MRRALYAEVLKSRNSFAVWLSLAGTAANLLMFFILHLFGQESVSLDSTPNPWEAWILSHYAGMAFMMLPLYVIILAALVHFMEHRHDMWTQLYALPVGRQEYVMAKVSYIFLLFVTAHLLFVTGLLITGFIYGLAIPDSGLATATPPATLLLRLAMKTVVSVIGLMCVQSWISRTFPHFIVSLLVGILGFVCAGLIGPEWPGIAWIPWGQPMVLMPEVLGEITLPTFGGLTTAEWGSLGYGVVFLGLALFREVQK